MTDEQYEVSSTHEDNDDDAVNVSEYQKWDEFLSQAENNDAIYINDDECQTWEDFLADSSESNEDDNGNIYYEGEKWEDFVLSQRIFPEYEYEAKAYILSQLGFSPSQYYSSKYETHIRAALQQEKAGQISFDELLYQVRSCCMYMRNEYFITHSHKEYEPHIYEYYKEYSTEFSTLVVERLSKFLGYQPDIKHSIYVEVLMRKSFLEGELSVDSEITYGDIKALSVIKYREILLKEGKEAADASPLIGFEIQKRYRPDLFEDN